MVVEVFHADLVALEQELQEKLTVAPAFFRNAPVLMDFEHLEDAIDLKWFNDAYDMLYMHSFIPVGVVAPPDYLKQAIAKQQIAVWPSAETARKGNQSVSSRHEDSVAEQQEADTEERTVPEDQQDESGATATSAGQTVCGELVDEPQAQPTMLVLQPVRSGQKVYAKGGDLIIMAAVSTGAEVMADGHIHVYGTLRGRAFAGAQGDESARIFCKDLQADLISVAGTYLINDDLPQKFRGASVQVYLREEQLIINPL